MKWYNRFYEFIDTYPEFSQNQLAFEFINSTKLIDGNCGLNPEIKRNRK